MRNIEEVIAVVIACIGLASCGQEPAPKKLKEPRASIECPVIGNSKSHIYHVLGSTNYRQMLEENTGKDNRVCFGSTDEAEKAGYRRSRSGATDKRR